MDCDRPNRNTRITISLGAIQHNLQRCRQLAGNARIFAVLKADAYGHGAVEILPPLAAADGIAVVSVAEALTVRNHREFGEILILQGASSKAELDICVAKNLSVVVHCAEQIDLLCQLELKHRRCWLKIDSGMGRLGFLPREIETIRARLHAAGVQITGLMTHLSCADDRQQSMTDQQLQNFTQLAASWSVPLPQSMANSAALLSRADTVFDWVRPGLMLYGASPFVDESAIQHGLRAAMRVEAPVIAIRDHTAGQGIGYGATYICPTNMRVALIGIGYGDGYPRAAKTGTPVQIGGQLCPLLGRVSMDSIAVNVSTLGNRVAIGDLAVLWGSDTLPVEMLANSISMIPYELLCTIRGKRTWVCDI